MMPPKDRWLRDWQPEELGPTLILAWGNPARGDDALALRWLEAIAPQLPPSVAYRSEYQLLPEHALELVGRRRVLFVDASATAEPPFESLAPVMPSTDRAAFSHALSPAALLGVYRQLFPHSPLPHTALLAIRGEVFTLGASLSPAAHRHLRAALAWAREWLVKIQCER